MKVVYTEQAVIGLEESLAFLIEEHGLSLEKVAIMKSRLMNLADSLALNPIKGQLEEYLQHLQQDHRRLISGHIKIIYKIENNTVFITDFFDSRQDPTKMKGYTGRLPYGMYRTGFRVVDSRWSDVASLQTSPFPLLNGSSSTSRFMII